jgi:hypothetical protein
MSDQLKHRKSGEDPRRVKADFCLFHKWSYLPEIAEMKIPMVFWFFDLMTTTDYTLQPRMYHRQQWMNDVLPYCKLGFCTDGDWVAADKTGKLRWLMQGADERIIGKGITTDCPSIPLLFTGTIHHGLKRVEHIRELEQRYGERFVVFGNGGPLRRKHGRDLANLLATAMIIIAPDGPQTHRYWSNRVYQALGFESFLLHPYCDGLARQYIIGDELVCYRSREELHDMIEHYLAYAAQRAEIAEAGYVATVTHNLYRHRCEELIGHVERVL